MSEEEGEDEIEEEQDKSEEEQELDEATLATNDYVLLAFGDDKKKHHYLGQLLEKKDGMFSSTGRLNLAKLQ